MDKKFKFWKFLGALILPALIFFIIYALGMIAFIRLFYSYCTGPLVDEFEKSFMFFLILVLCFFELMISIIMIKRSKNLFVLIGFCISLIPTLFLTFITVRSKLTYKKRMMDISRWKEPYSQDEMVGYFINHNVYIGKTYEEIVNDLGEPRKTKIEGKYIYEITKGMWIYELFFENNKCIRQELYCIWFDHQARVDYDKENF